MIQALPLPSQTLRQRVAQVLPWASEASWDALFGGRTNSAWQLSLGTRSAVLKLYRTPSENPLFPNDPAAEAMLLDHLYGKNIAPELIASFDSDEGRSVLYHAIPGHRWQSNAAAAAALLKRLHALPAPNGLREIERGSAALLSQADEMLSRCANSDDVTALRPNLDVPETSDIALVHCDCVPGNLIENDSGLYLIDWQCPAIGDPCEDLAIFLSPAMQTLYRGAALNQEEREAFLHTYGGATAARYRQLAPAYHYRMAAYCLWQVERGKPDYAEGLIAETAALSALSSAN